MLLAVTAAVAATAPANAARRPPPPKGVPVVSAGQLPHPCAAGDERYGATGYSAVMGTYFDAKLNAWASAPYCYPVWGNLAASGSQIVNPGQAATIVATPNGGSNSGTYAPETKSITWSIGGTRKAGCGSADLSCTVVAAKRATGSWQWFEIKVSMPRTFFVDSPGSNCAGQHLCAGVTTNAWAFIGVRPSAVRPGVIRGRVVDPDGDPVDDVRVTASGPGSGADTTNRAGRYEIRLEQAGTYRVSPTSEDSVFSPERRSVKVANGGTATADFKLSGCKAPAASSGYDLSPAGIIAQLRPSHRPCLMGVDWQMPERLPAQVRAWGKGGDREPLPRSFVHPKKWRVNLFLTKQGRRVNTCAKGSKWRWTVTAPKGERVLTKPPIVGCTPEIDVSGLGTYRVRAENTKDGTKAPATGSEGVKVNDLVIVGVGDSNGSGEGNPSFTVRRCARGVTSYQFQVADYIEHQDDHTSVTFIFSACSGASVAHLITADYRGTVPVESAKLPPQFEQVGDLLSSPAGDRFGGPARKVDAALVSIGVNDLSFGPVLETCIKFGRLSRVPHRSCADERVRPRFDAANALYTFGYPSLSGTRLGSVVASFQRELPGRIRELEPALRRRPGLGAAGLGMRNLKRAFFTTYPDFSGSDTGEPCDTYDSIATLPRWAPETWQWLRDQSVELNRNVGRGASSIDATTVVVPNGLWARHGYCATDSWFVPVLSAVVKGDATGPFHPNVTGHTIEAGYNARAVCRALRGRADCRADGEPRPGASLPIPG